MEPRRWSEYLASNSSQGEKAALLAAFCLSFGCDPVPTPDAGVANGGGSAGNGGESGGDGCDERGHYDGGLGVGGGVGGGGTTGTGGGASGTGGGSPGFDAGQVVATASVDLSSGHGGVAAHIAWAGSVPHATYQDEGPGWLRHAERTADGWVSEVVDQHADPHIIHDIAASPSGAVAITFSRHNANFTSFRGAFVARRIAGAWAVTELTPSLSLARGLTIDDAGVVRLGLVFNGHLFLVTLHLDSISSEFVTTPRALNWMLMRLGPDGSPIFIMENLCGARIARKTAGTWEISHAPIARVADATVSSSGALTLVGDLSTGALARVQQDGAGWTTNVLPETPLRGGIALEGSTPVVRWVTSSQLIIGRLPGGPPGWSWQQQTASVLRGNTQASTVTVDGAGQPAYAAHTTEAEPARGLMFVRFASFPAGEQVEPLDLRMGASPPLLVATGADGLAHVVFVEGPDLLGVRRVVVADQRAGAWARIVTPVALEGADTAARPVTIEAAWDGDLAILQSPLGAGSVRLWRRGASGWTTTMLAPYPASASPALTRAFAMGPDGHARVLVTGDGVATWLAWSGSTWESADVASWPPTGVPARTQLVSIADGGAHAGLRLPDGTLQHARYGSGAWSLETLARDSAGLGFQLGVDAVGRGCFLYGTASQSQVTCTGDAGTEVLASEPFSGPLLLDFDATGRRRAFWFGLAGIRERADTTTTTWTGSDLTRTQRMSIVPDGGAFFAWTEDLRGTVNVASPP